MKHDSSLGRRFVFWCKGSGVAGILPVSFVQLPQKMCNLPHQLWGHLCLEAFRHEGDGSAPPHIGLISPSSPPHAAVLPDKMLCRGGPYECS